MPKKSMSDHFLHAYYKGRKISRWKYALTALIVVLTSGGVTYLAVAAVQSPTEIVIFPSFLTLLGLLIGLSRKTEFLIPFWIVVGILLGSTFQVIGHLWGI